MKTFDYLELSEILNANLQNLGADFDGKALWRDLYKGRAEASEVVLTLNGWHMRTRDRLDAEITGWMLDSNPLTLTPVERFMLRLRFENAVGGLHLLQRSRTPRSLPRLLVQCSQLEEALLWSLTVFWDFYGPLTIQRAARTFLRGDGTTLVQLSP